MNARSSFVPKSLDRVVTATGVLVTGAAVPLGVINWCGGSSIPLAIILWCFLCLLVRLGFLLTGGLFGNQDRGRVFVALCAFLAIPCAILAFSAPTGRHRDTRTLCINQLRQLAGAKDALAYETKRPAGADVAWEEIVGAHGYIKVHPVCSSGGVYSLGKIGELPRCSLESDGHRIATPY